MRDENRIDEILTDLGEYWKEHPDLRLCQLITNLVGDNNYNVEDTILIKELQRKNVDTKQYKFKSIITENDIRYGYTEDYFLAITPNNKKYSNIETERPICVSIYNLVSDDLIGNEMCVGIDANITKEIIKALQEIVACIEGE